MLGPVFRVVTGITTARECETLGISADRDREGPRRWFRVVTGDLKVWCANDVSR